MQTKQAEISYHKTIHKLPLCKFVDCLVDNNLAALTITGFPEQKELEDAWVTILGQYSDLVGKAEYRVYVQLYKEVSILKITLEQIRVAISILQMAYDKFFGLSS